MTLYFIPTCVENSSELECKNFINLLFDRAIT